MTAKQGKSMEEIMASKPQGYHRLANVMSNDASFAIFRNFNEINVLNLLSLQAEINDLRHKFGFLHRSDDVSNDATRREFSRRFLLLHRSEGDKGRQYQTLLQLRSKMKEYNDLVLQVNAINRIARPQESHLSILRDWLQDPKGGNNFQKGTEDQIWDEADPSVYLTLFIPAGEMDIFSRCITRIAVGIFHRTWGEKHGLGKVVDEESGLVSYDDSKINMASTIFATVISSILPVVAILILYVVKNTVKRICITLAFTAAFACVLATCSSARRVEIFAATATFAAVEVVFIGSAIAS